MLHTLRHLARQRILQCPDQMLAKVVLLPSHNNGCLLYRFVSECLAQVLFEPLPVHEILRLEIESIDITLSYPNLHYYNLCFLTICQHDISLLSYHHRLVSK